jgi:hypothetical protein
MTWHDIVTFAESWFYLSTDYEFVWLPRDEKFPKEKAHNSIEKMHAHDLLESDRVLFDQGSRKRSQVQRRQLYR